MPSRGQQRFPERDPAGLALPGGERHRAFVAPGHSYRASFGIVLPVAAKLRSQIGSIAEVLETYKEFALRIEVFNIATRLRRCTKIRQRAAF